LYSQIIAHNNDKSVWNHTIFFEQAFSVFLSLSQAFSSFENTCICIFFLSATVNGTTVKEMLRRQNVNFSVFQQNKKMTKVFTG